MSDDRVPADVQNLWQGQPVTGGTMSLDELRRRSRYVERRVGRRNLREYIGAVVVLFWFGWVAWIAPSPMIRVAAVLILAATIFVVYHLRRYGTAKPMPADLALTGCLQFYRGELERQRDLLRGAWKWYVLPFAPGLMLIYLGQLMAHPGRASRALWPAAATVLFMVAVSELNRHVAKKIQVKIDELERDL